MVASEGACAGPAPPEVRRALGRSLCKGEDAFGEVPPPPAEQGLGGGPSPAFRAFGVFDGHGGKQAAAHCAKHLVAELGRGLASLAAEAGEGTPPLMEAAVPALLSRLFVETDRAWCEEQRPSGTTATVAVLSGWEVVVASVGDSDLWLDTGAEIVRVSESHRLGSCTREQKRVRLAGGSCARSEVQGKPVGPLRAWPGGLAMSRTIGDAAAAGVVIAEPGLRRVTVPPSGGRLVLASDGLWDAWSPKAALKGVRNMAAGSAAQRLIKTALQKRGLRDDITLYVVDLLPAGETRFPSGPEAAAAEPVWVRSPGEERAPHASKGGVGAGLGAGAGPESGSGSGSGAGSKSTVGVEAADGGGDRVGARPHGEEAATQQAERGRAPPPRKKESRRKSPKPKKPPPATAPDVGGEDDEGWTTVKKAGRRGADKSGEGRPKGAAAPRGGAAAPGRASSAVPGRGGGAYAGDGRRVAAQGTNPPAKPSPPAAAVPPPSVPFGALNGCFVPELNYRPLNALDPFAGTRFSFPGAFTIPLAGPDLAGPDLAGPGVAGNEGPAVDATI